MPTMLLDAVLVLLKNSGYFRIIHLPVLSEPSRTNNPKSLNAFVARSAVLDVTERAFAISEWVML